MSNVGLTDQLHMLVTRVSLGLWPLKHMHLVHLWQVSVSQWQRAAHALDGL